eukprot:scaffold1026_cov409-Prasinococcus_capsulatus_cf.AAC.40
MATPGGRGAGRVREGSTSDVRARPRPRACVCASCVRRLFDASAPPPGREAAVLQRARGAARGTTNSLPARAGHHLEGGWPEADHPNPSLRSPLSTTVRGYAVHRTRSAGRPPLPAGTFAGEVVHVAALF